MEKNEQSAQHDFYYTKTTIRQLHKIYSEFRASIETILKITELCSKEKSFKIPEKNQRSVDLLISEFALNFKKSTKENLDALILEISNLGEKKKINGSLSRIKEEISSEYFMKTQNENQLIEKEELKGDILELSDKLNSYTFVPLSPRSPTSRDPQGLETQPFYEYTENDEGFAIPQKSTLETEEGIPLKPRYENDDNNSGEKIEYNPYLNPGNIGELGENISKILLSNLYIENEKSEIFQEIECSDLKFSRFKANKIKNGNNINLKNKDVLLR